MSYAFKRVVITSFDISIALLPLQLPESQAVQEACRFLVRSDEYGAQHESRLSVTTPHLRIDTLSMRELTRSHFWKYYKQTWLADDKPDYWKLQAPFECVPHDGVALDLTAAALPAGVQAHVEPVIFLSGIGWSVNINIELAGDMESAQCLAFRDQLHGRDRRLFTVQGRARSLSELHAFFSDQIVADVYPQTNPPAAVRKVDRHMVFSILEFAGPIQLFRRTWRDGPKTVEMGEADRALMRHLLYGREVQGDKDADHEITYTQFTDANFALTDFDRGTLIFMQDMAAAEVAASGLETLRCLHHNVCRSSMMLLMLFHFYDSTSGQTAPKLRKLHDWMPQSLQGMKDRYSNRVCQAWFTNRPGLQKLTKSDPPPA